MRGAVHRAAITHVVGHTRDVSGRTTPIEMTNTVRAVASLLGQGEQLIADQRGRTVSVAIQVPPTTPVATKDNVVVAGTGRLELDGRYTIVEVRPDRRTKRLLCARYEV